MSVLRGVEVFTGFLVRRDQREYWVDLGCRDRLDRECAGDAEVTVSPRLASMVPRFMAKTSVVPKKKRGPAPTGKGVQVGERWHPSELAAIDAWIAASSDKTLTRAHAIRRLVALGLKAKGK
jgi:hypothetical protein